MPIATATSPEPPRRVLNVGFVTETYLPEVNGVAHTVARLVGELVQRGHRLQLVRPRQTSDESGGCDGTVRDLLVCGMPLPGYSGLRMGLPADRTLREAWRNARPDVLYVATEGMLGWSAVRVASRLGIPVVSGFHTNFHAYSRHYGAALLHRFIYAYLRALHNRTACTLVPTGELRERLSGDGFYGLEVLGRGVDTSLFSPDRRSLELRRRWGLRDDERAVLYVGRLAAEKNLPLALEAFQAMKAIDSRLLMVVVGDGPLYQSLARQQPDVVFCGIKTGLDLATHYASGDLFLFPSETETFGNVTLEAMASGLAVVAFDYAAARLCLRSEADGLTVPLKQPDAFIRAAERLAADCELGVRLGQAACKCAANYDWARVVDDFEQLLYRYASEVITHGSDSRP